MASTLADILVTLTLDTGNFSQRLRQVGQELNNFKNTVSQTTSNMEADWNNSMGSMATSMNQLNNSTRATTRVVRNSMNIVSDNLNTAGGSTEDLAETVRDSTEGMNDSFNSVRRTSRTLARTLGTSLRDSRRVLVAGGREFQAFGGHGMRVADDIRHEFSSLPRHLQLYVQRLREAGQSTEQFARLNEAYGRRQVEAMRRSNDYTQQRTLQSTRLMNSFANDTNLAPLTNGFLQMGQRMEATARQGTVLNVALQRIGENGTFRDLQDQMRFVQQGLARARGALLVFAIAGGLAVWGMIELASAVDKRVAPAFENMKKQLVDAFMPFITAFATGMVAVMNFVSGIAKMIDKFSEAHPTIFAMIMSIMMLTLVLGALLSPLAVTGIWAQGVAASFTALWAVIAPFVLGVLAVIGVALALATAIAVLWMSVKNLWANSEAFRNAFINLWNGIKTAVIDGVITPVVGAWDKLKKAFLDLIATFTGGEGTISNMWTFLGDKIAIVVNYISSAVLPILKSAFSILGQAIVTIIDGIIYAINWLGDMWKEHGTQISSVMAVIWSVIQTVFGAVVGFIMEQMPTIKAIISDTFNAIKSVIDFVMKYIAPVVVTAFGIIWEVIKFLMPTIKSLIVGTWNNIKSVITSALAIIQNTIQLFSNILKGNWSGAWENIKAILSNAVTLIWNLIQLYFLGRLLAPFKGFISAGKSVLTGGFKLMVSIIKGSLTALKVFVTGVFTAMKTVLTTTVTQMRTTAMTRFNALKTGAISTFNALKSKATSIFNAIKTAMTNPIEKAKKVIMDIVAKIVGAFASMKISIPEIKLPKLSIGKTSKTIMGKEFSVPTFDVKWNAKGGIFNGASILGGGQGVGEAGAEAVLPVQHKRYMKPFAGAIASHLQAMTGNTESEKSTGDSQYVINFNEPVVIREDADIQRIVDELERRKRISERAKGVFSY